MIELNLLPDVKMEYIKAQNMRRMVFTISAIVTIVSVVLLGSLISVDQLQKKHLKDLTADIAKESADLKGKSKIGKILTVQNQLGSLTQLHDAKPAAHSLFTYLNQVTPTNVSISSFHADFTQYTMTITGSADSLSDVNKYIDTLKFTNYKSAETKKSPAFGNVVLGTFAIGNATQQTNSKPATFSISLNYDPKIFNIAKPAQLIIPKKTTTRSTVDNPPPLFQAAAPTATAETGATGTSTTPTTTGGN